MKTSEEIKELVAALVKANLKIKNPAADQTNDYYGSKYADLADGLDETRVPLAENGIVLIQVAENRFAAPPFPGAPMAFVDITSRLAHECGQFIETTSPMPVVRRAKKKDTDEDAALAGIPTSQDFAAATTYGRRIFGYALLSIAKKGDDDDGNGGSGKGDGQKKAERPPAAQLAPRPAPAASNAAPPVNGKPMSARIKALNDSVILTNTEHSEIRAMIPKLVGADLEKFIAGWEKDLTERKGAVA